MANKKQMARAAAEAARKAEQAKTDKRNMIIGIIAVILAAAVVLGFILSGTGGTKTAQQPTTISGPSAIAEMTEKATHLVTIEVENHGTITAELYGEAAPITVANFVKLAGEGFYDGLTFHRIISGFMVQGGDPKGNGTGGSDETIKGEFFINGVDNPIKHKRGVLSMARSSDNNSASSQFFIMHAAAPHLDGSYAAFGCVREGIEVVDSLCTTPVLDGNGTVAKANQPKIVSVKVAEITE